MTKPKWDQAPDGSFHRQTSVRDSGCAAAFVFVMVLAVAALIVVYLAKP